ncbi:myotrophin isoform X3 [Drosophila obscura]|uniref:myotrophin isoform X3 n=1 Tax=Drosophila obscura TaxID=7282 RepID=UPI000BA1788D|nr:myotrophin isoform X3 [Drosophila obscura]
MSEKVIWTIKNGEFDAVQDAFKNDALKVNEEIKGRYPIHYAADFGQLKKTVYIHTYSIHTLYSMTGKSLCTTFTPYRRTGDHNMF